MKLTYSQQLNRLINKARKHGDKMQALYYTHCLFGVACQSWEMFRTSWAGQQWIQRWFPAAA